jgi:hypothetical protein
MLKIFKTWVVSIQFSSTSPSKCKCYSLFGNLMSCSFLISSFYSLNCLSYGDVIYDIPRVFLIAYAIISTVITIVGTTYGSILPLKCILSCSVFILEPEAPPSSTLFFLLRTLIGESMATFFLFFSIIYISSVFLTLTNGFCGLSFWCTTKYWKIFANTKAY